MAGTSRSKMRARAMSELTAARSMKVPSSPGPNCFLVATIGETRKRSSSSDSESVAPAWPQSWSKNHVRGRFRPVRQNFIDDRVTKRVRKRNSSPCHSVRASKHSPNGLSVTGNNPSNEISVTSNNPSNEISVASNNPSNEISAPSNDKV